MGGGASGCSICWATAANEGTARPAGTSARESVAGYMGATPCEAGAVTSSTCLPPYPQPWPAVLLLE
eukprot:11178631-Lingulodinium_polyedra.AAC.1